MNFASLRVMVVEDHPFQRSVIAEALRTLGVVGVFDAANGDTALAQLRHSTRMMDIAICDLSLPGMDGVEVIRHIAEERLARAVILCSAAEHPVQEMVAAMAAGYGLRVLGFIGKPMSVRDLEGLIEKLGDEPEAAAAPVRAPAGLEVRKAFERGEFVAAYQPKVIIPGGAPAGVEALCRWRSPAHGHIGPATFIPALAEEKLLDALTERLVAGACRQQAAWRAGGLGLPVSINVTLGVLADTRTADRYGDLVRDLGGAPRDIVFEITETEAMREDPDLLNVLARLRLKGFGLSIDDFGVGYSTLQQLGLIAFTEMKIDRGFVRHCDRNDRLRTFVASNIELGRRLGLATVAEGVETAEEWDVLAELGCQQAQGYHVARPMPPEEILPWARARPPVADAARAVNGG